ncbi:hypothetical protein HCH52_06205 [Oscillospiraceae bacterium HV4-5-C5C]|nr:hypothetical protein [Oscillospiraceae bacterium]MDD4367880.1 hypothetical protein [Oscillospiraceae bacterium]NJP40642.1 hypothetical protein [Oscillospiraceae bacterium HV4-5-C5C]
MSHEKAKAMSVANVLYAVFLAVLPVISAYLLMVPQDHYRQQQAQSYNYPASSYIAVLLLNALAYFLLALAVALARRQAGCRVHQIIAVVWIALGILYVLLDLLLRYAGVPDVLSGLNNWLYTVQPYPGFLLALILGPYVVILYLLKS